VSVVIPLYNYGRYIENTVASVLGQTCGNVQLIVVNNGSTDDGPERVAAIKDPRLTLLHIKENRGPIPAWRLGLEHCRGEWFAMLPADDYWKPQKLERQFDYLRDHSDINILATWLEQVDSNGRPNETEVQYIERHCNRHFDFNNLNTWTWDHRVCIPSAIYRKDLCDAAGPPSVGMDHIADWEFHLRLLRAGGKVGVVPEKLTCYRWHGNNLSKSGLSSCLSQWIWGFLTQYVPLTRQWLKTPEAVDAQLSDAISFLFTWPVFNIASREDRLRNFYALLDGADPLAKWPTYRDYTTWLREAEIPPAARATAAFLGEWQKPDFTATREMLFDKIYRIRRGKDSDFESPNMEKELMSSLGRGWYALYWSRHKLTRPFENLHRSVKKRWDIGRRRTCRPPRDSGRPSETAQTARTRAGSTTASQPAPSRTLTPIIAPPRADRPLVSVVIPLYNYGRYIENTIASVLGQTCGNLELIVVNNGSTDDGPERVAAINDPRLTLLHIQENKGPIPAWRLGFEHCRGEWFAMLSADDYWKPRKLERQFEFLRKRPDISMLGTWIEQVDENGVPNESQVPFIERHCNRFVQFDDLHSWRWNHHLCIPSALYRKDLCDSAGPPSLGMNHIADWEFHMRLLRAGGRVAVIQEPLTCYRWHGRNLSKHGKFECLTQWVWGFLTQYVPLAQKWLESPAAVEAELADAISFFLTEPVFVLASERERLMNFYGFLLSAGESTGWPSYYDYLEWVEHGEVPPAALATLYLLDEWQSPQLLKRRRKGPWFTRMARRIRKKLGFHLAPLNPAPRHA
jgi:glycosyltransferase involved in cell wall biosynthesis